MSYLAFCTFDLKNASSQDYQKAYTDLEALGLKKVAVGSNGNKIIIPTTSVMGTFDGQSTGAVRDHVRSQVESAFSRRGFTSEIFVVVGDDWSWGATTT